MYNKNDLSNFAKINEIIDDFFKYIKEYNINEVFFLLSPSVETELIIRVFKEKIIKEKININLKRLNIGIPFGGSIEHSTKETLKEAIEKNEKA